MLSFDVSYDRRALLSNKPKNNRSTHPEMILIASHQMCSHENMDQGV